MNIQLFSRALKLVGALLVVTAYLLIAKLSFASAIAVTWIGISFIATSLFIHTKKPEARNKHLKHKEVGVRGRSREVEA